jgi:cytochrome c oxidase subunit II
MTALFIFLSVVLVAIVLLQIGKATELIRQIKGDDVAEAENSKWNGWLSLGFLFLFLIGCVGSAWHMHDYMLGYGLNPASEHGNEINSLFNVTLFFTGIVFVLTHIALFWFAYKYRWQKNQKSIFFPHDNKLEIWWTAIPAVVMTFLVIRGLDAWNRIMSDVKDGEDYIEIEATAQQFFWTLRYPGADNKLGTRDFRLTTGKNPLGQDWLDTKNFDDFQSTEVVLPVGKKVRVRIIAKDVLHNFYLPHFYVKMDAIPGLPTYFIFTPTKTTAQYRDELRLNPAFQEPFDKAEPNGARRWEKFDYELACAELCGKGHYSMRRVVRIVTEAEYQTWLTTQKSYYEGNIKGTDDDPNKNSAEARLKMEKAEFEAELSKAMAGKTDAEKILNLKHINFETGSDKLTDDSHFELDNLASALAANPNVKIELDGHTDNVGNPASNLDLSKRRAASALNYLVAKGVAAARLTSNGFGDLKPISPNDSDENKAKNRRTECRILAQ